MKKSFFLKTNEQREKLAKALKNESSTILNLHKIVGGKWYDIMEPEWAESTWQNVSRG